MYASLNDSYQWNHLNSGNALNEKIADVMKNGEVVGPDRIPTALLTLKNKLKSPIMSKILEAIEDRTLTMIYTPKIKIPMYLPFILTKAGPHTVKGFVFMNNLDAKCDTEGGEIFLNVRKLKVALESCFIGMTLGKTVDSPKMRSTTILRSGSRIYSNIIAECINRRHGTKIDPVVHNSILYLASRYYVGTMIGCRGTMDPETMRNYCFYNCKNIEFTEIGRVVESFEEKDFNNIGTFITKLSQVEALQKRLGNLTISNFIESYINMYDASMLLALENFYYFMYNVEAVLESTYTNNYQVLKNIVGDDGKKIYSDLIVTTMSL